MIMLNSLCAAFSKASIDTWYRIQEGRSLYWLGEETLTDLMIRDLMRLHLSGFNVKAFHKKDEGKNGADWEWWFQGNSGNWIGMRVQAKIINEFADKFKKLHDYHKDVKTHLITYQSEKLIASALAAKPGPCIPVYCLYSHWFDLTYNTMLPIWVAHLNPINFGCSIISAAAVRHLRITTGTGKAHRCDLVDTLPYTIPLAGLVCSPFAAANSSIAERIQNVMEVGAEFLLPSPPPYVIDLIERQNKQPLRTIERPSRNDIDLPTGVIGVLAIQQIGER